MKWLRWLQFGKVTRLSHLYGTPSFYIAYWECSW
jgi:hypothetical protein